MPETCRAEDLMAGDVIDSHDGLDHLITNVDFSADSPFGHVIITVDRSDGVQYQAELERDSEVTVS